jgi:hypothetical protein
MQLIALETATTLVVVRCCNSVNLQLQLVEHTTSNRWATGFWYQLRVLLERQGKQSRGEAFSAVNIFQILAVAIIASAVWWQSNNIRDTTGVFFFISIQQSFNAVSACFTFACV